MKGMMGLIFVLIGAGIMVYGASIALREVSGLYQGALDNPLGQPADRERDTAAAMVRGVFVGAQGILACLVGGGLIKTWVYAKSRH